MRSIRQTLLVGSLLGVTGILLASGVLIYALVRSSLVDQHDRSLMERAQLLASTVEVEGGQIDLQFMEFDIQDFQREENPAYLQVWREKGPPLFRSPSLAGNSLSRCDDATNYPHCRWMGLPDGGEVRAVAIRFFPMIAGGPHGDVKIAGTPGSGAPELTLVLAQGIAPIQSTLSALKKILAASGLAATIVSALVLWVVIRQSLRSMLELSGEIAELDTTDLSKRVNAGGSVQELSPVTQQVNGLLERMQSAMDRERAFSSDVAHELRTPLAGFRSILDVTLSKPRAAEAYREALEKCLQIAVQMQGIVENLLTMARLEAGQVDIHPESFVPHDVLRATWRSMVPAAQGRGLRIQWELGPEFQAFTDVSLFRMIVRNLLENAIAYTDAAGQVKVSTRFNGTLWDVCISNTGSQISQERSGKVFERFWRGDAARSETGIHCGLGLTLVKNAARFLGGSVKVQSDVGREFLITVTLGAPPSAPMK